MKGLVKYGDFIYKGVVFLFMVAILYFNAHYVTSERFASHEAANQAQYQETSKALSTIAVTLAEMKKQDTQLQDHEVRIRALEAKR